MLTISRVVIHELVKEVRVNEASTYLSDSLLEITEEVNTLVEKLNDSYSKGVINYATFNTSDGRVFPSEFARFLNSQRQDADFLTFTKVTLNNLRDQIRNVVLAKGGFFIFTEYQNQNNTYLSVYLVRDSEGVLFKKVNQTHSFQVDKIKYMNTEKLAMGCRINVDRHEAQDGNYLSLIKNKQIDISDYFYNWVAVQQSESSTEFTNTLYEIVNNIDLPTKDDNTRYTVDEFRKSVVDYINTQPSKIVNLLQMGLHFYNDERKFTNYASLNDLIIDHEFRTNAKALKRFVRVEINADGINLKFTRGEFTRKVKISEHNPNQIIIESERFARALRTEINT